MCRPAILPSVRSRRKMHGAGDARRLCQRWVFGRRAEHQPGSLHLATLPDSRRRDRLRRIFYRDCLHWRRDHRWRCTLDKPSITAEPPPGPSNPPGTPVPGGPLAVPRTSGAGSCSIAICCGMWTGWTSENDAAPAWSRQAVRHPVSRSRGMIRLWRPGDWDPESRRAAARRGEAAARQLPR